MAELSDYCRGQIEVLNEEGYSQRQIASRLDVSKTAVQKTLARIRDCGSYERKSRHGRPRCTTTQTDRFIHRCATADPATSSSNIQAQLPQNCQVSTRTIRRRLYKDFKLRACRPAPKPSLSSKNIRDRLNFCKLHQHWSVEQWRNVMFSGHNGTTVH
jgi:transposase